MNNNELKHHGVKGMRWGVRKAESSSTSGSRGTSSKTKAAKKQLTPEQKKAITKKVLIGIGAAAAVTAGVLYLKNKDKVDGSVKNFFSKFKKNKPTKTDLNARNRMDRMVKRRRTLSTEKLRDLETRLRLEKSISELNAEQNHAGRKFAQSVLSDSGKKVATVVVTGGTLYAIKAAISRKASASEAAGYIAPKPKNK